MIASFMEVTHNTHKKWWKAATITIDLQTGLLIVYYIVKEDKKELGWHRDLLGATVFVDEI